MKHEKAIKHYEEGKLHYRNGKYSAAERAYKKAIKFNADFADAHNDLGNLYLKTGRLKESFNAYRKALKVVPDHPMLLNNIGNVLTTQGDYKNAITWLDKALRLDPDSAAAHCNLANALRRLGENTRAVNSYRRAIELDPRQPMFLCNLGEVLIEAEELHDAIGCFERALQIKPGYQRAYLGLGKAWNALGDLDQAVSSYQQAISTNPASAKSYRGLARVLGDHGEIEQAISALRKAIEIDPGSASAYQALARNKRFTEYDADIKAMESLFSARGMTDIQKSQLAFSLGKAFEDLDEFDKSMEFVIKAARLKRSLFDYSISESKARFDAIKAVFSSDFFSRCIDVGNPDRTPIFIVGMPRSGTSLVEQILASHPDVFGAGELNVLSQVFQTIANETDSLPQAMLELNPDAYADMGEQYIQRIRRHSAESTFITDKLPGNYMRIGFIRAVLPNARVILCTRDPLDNCLSLFKTDFEGGHPYSYDMSELGQYFNLYRTLMDHWKTTLPGFIYEQSYEELVSHQEEQTRLLLQHCDLPWDDACMEFHKTRRKISTASNAQVSRPIYQNSVNLWTRYEKHLQPLLSALND